jgi:hypothetical protein
MLLARRTLCVAAKPNAVAAAPVTHMRETVGGVAEVGLS